MFDKVLCPIDFSVTSGAAYSWTEHMAQRFQSDVVFAHVLPFLGTNFAAGAEVSGYLTYGLVSLREFVCNSKTKHREVIGLGDAHQEILHLANTLKVTGIVMGTRGITSHSHMLLGSTTERVMRESSVPVMTISSFCGNPVESHTKRILIPVSSLENFSGHTLRRIVREIGGSLTVLHVSDVKDFVFDFNYRGSPFHVVEAEIGERKQSLAKIGADLSPAFTKIEVQPLIRFGDVASEILKEIETDQYNFVLMKVKKQTLLSRFSESVAYQLISLSKIPVITVKTNK